MRHLLLLSLVAVGACAREPGPASIDSSHGKDDVVAEMVATDAGDPVEANGASEGVAMDDLDPEERQRLGDNDCARVITRAQNVPSMSGGAMQMIMVTECVPADESDDDAGESSEAETDGPSGE